MGLKARLATKEKIGRIWFVGNPWPGGHEIAELEWTARLREDGALWFDLHLRTRDYSDEYPISAEEEEEDADSAWEASAAWRNYHSTILSSTYWSDDGAFKVATPDSPLQLSRLGSRHFHIDPLPGAQEAAENDDDMAFNIYCLGHDAVADHKITFTPRSDGQFDLSWRGLHANAYVGDYRFQNEFQLQAVTRLQEVVCEISDRAAARKAMALVAPDVETFGAKLVFR